MDEQKTLIWLEAVCTEALQEWRKGNTRPANQLPAPVRFAFQNIYAVRTMAPEFFNSQYPTIFQECDSIRVSVEHDTLLREQVAMMPDLQARLASQGAEIEALKTAIAKLTGQVATPVVASEPTQAEGDDPPAVTDGEGETETTNEQPPAEAEPKKTKGK